MGQAFINGHVLDGTLNEDGRMVAHDWTVIISGSKISAMGPAAEVDTQGHEVIDLGGAWVAPGLVNLHAHLASAGSAAKKNAKPIDYKKLFSTLDKIPFVMRLYMELEKAAAKNQLLSGTTTVRTVGGIKDHDGQIRDLIDAGKMVGPRLLVCNTAVSVPGGHFAGSLATEASSAQEAADHVQQIAATNPDWIKLMITGGVMDASEKGEPGALRMAPELVRSACETAHSLGYRVSAHVESPEGVRVALENGVDTIEHGAAPDETIIDLFHKRQAADVCTISPAIPYAVFSPEDCPTDEVGRHNGSIVMNGIVECAKACLAAGIPVGLGTDSGCPFITHYDMWRELVYFTRYCGVTPDFALHTATLINAQILGLDQELGSLKPGKSADLIVCAENPLCDLSRLRTLRYVMCRGHLIKDPKPKRMAKVDAALDKYL